MFSPLMSTLDCCGISVFDNMFVPDGYELVEKQEHKKKRLEDTIKSLEIQLQYHSKQGGELTEILEKTKKDLEALGKEKE